MAELETTTWRNILVGVGIGVLTTLLGTGLTRALFREREATLVVSAQFGSVEYPPNLVSELRTIGPGIDADIEVLRKRVQDGLLLGKAEKIQDALKSATGLERHCQVRAAEAVAAYLSAELPRPDELLHELDWLSNLRMNQPELKLLSALSYPESAWPRGYWKLTIRNRGEASAEAAEIEIPGAEYVRLSLKGAKTVELEVSETVEVGTILPGGEVSVLAWTRHEPSEYDVPNIGVRHASGTGKVEARVLAGQGFRSLESLWESLRVLTPIFGIALVGALVITAVVARFMPDENRKRPGGKETKDTPDQSGPGVSGQG